MDKKRIALFVCSLLLMTQLNIPVLARELPDEETLAGTESVMLIEEEPQNLTSTVNIRCYVDEEISEWDETIIFTIYNATINDTFNFQLNAVNGYYDNINVVPGKCYLYATIMNNDGTYKLYYPEQYFEVADSINLVCAYGDDTFIDSLKPNWDLLEIYEMTDLSTLPEKEMIEDIEITENELTEITIIEEEINDAEIKSNDDMNESNSKETGNINIPGLILFIIMIVYIGFNVNKIRQKKRS